MAISSWDNNTRIYEVQQNGQTVPKAMITHDGPALCCSWSKVIYIGVYFYFNFILIV